VQIGTSAVPEDNFYVQSNTDGAARASVLQQDVGTGVPRMSLTSAVGSASGRRRRRTSCTSTGRSASQNALYLSGDSRWSSLTYNAHPQRANSTWEFPTRRTRQPRSEWTAIWGFPRIGAVPRPCPATIQVWTSRVMVRGDTGQRRHRTGARRKIGDVQGGHVATGGVRFSGMSAAADCVGGRIVWGAIKADGRSSRATVHRLRPLGSGRYQNRLHPRRSPARPTMGRHPRVRGYHRERRDGRVGRETAGRPGCRRPTRWWPGQREWHREPTQRSPSWRSSQVMTSGSTYGPERRLRDGLDDQPAFRNYARNTRRVSRSWSRSSGIGRRSGSAAADRGSNPVCSRSSLRRGWPPAPSTITPRRGNPVTDPP